MVEAAAAVVVNLVLGNLTKVLPEQLEPHKELLAKAEAEVMEPEVVVAVVDKMAVLAVDWSPVTTAAFRVKMATVWHPEVVCFLVEQLVVVAPLIQQDLRDQLQ